MKKKRWLFLLGFNLIFAVIEVVLFSRGFLNLTENPLAAVLAAAVSVGLFFGVNYWLLNADSSPATLGSSKLRDAQDYRDALESWISNKNPFNNELREAIHQLDLFYQKQTALRALLGAQAKEPGNPFLSMSEDVQDYLFTNMKKLINRMTILDLNDASRFQEHGAFIHHVLGQNKQLLNQYDSLIIEISQIGDSANVDALNLEGITAALRELRDGGSYTEVTEQFKQQSSGE